MPVLHDDDLGQAIGLYEAGLLEDLIGPVGLADRVVVGLIDRLGADCRSDHDRRDHERQPAEDGRLAMARTPATHPGRQIASGVNGWTLHRVTSDGVCLMHVARVPPRRRRVGGVDWCLGVRIAHTGRSVTRTVCEWEMPPTPRCRSRSDRTTTMPPSNAGRVSTDVDLGFHPMRVVLGEDSLLLRAGVARLLEDAGIEVVGQAGDFDDVLRKVRAHKPDVAIVDIKMPPTHTDEGLKAALIIRSELPGTAVLVLSQYVEREYASELLAENAEGVGYLLKERVADLDRFIDAVRRVADGGSALDPEVVSQMLARRSAGPLDQLTAREREVLALMAEGRSNHAIASELVVTERAVEKHVTGIFGKLGLPATAEDHRRVLAVLAYLSS